ncbi:MAG TPA: TlpA disulfide reductase family protein [Allosphingosinicella sp.]|nr:TlpA disulfide reductase family protein [Allosphingosinicella sp.]
MRPGIASLLGLGALLSVGCDRQKAAEPQGAGPAAPPARAAAPAASYPTGRLDRSHAGTAVPAAPFEDGEGRSTTLAEFRGRPLLLNLWATWCAPCVVEMPSLDRLAGREDGRVQVVAISQDLDGREAVDRFFARTGLANLEPFLDGDMALMTALRIGTLPTTILYDAEGREVWRMTGMAEWDGERARRLLAEAERVSPSAAR